MKSLPNDSGYGLHFSKRNLLVTVILSVLGFTILTLLVFSSVTSSIDQNVINTAQTWETEQRNKCMLFITWLGNYQFLVPANLLLIAFFLLNQKKKIAAWVFLIAITGLGLKFLLKAVFARPRPDNPIVEGINNYSYPSGHALMSVAFYGLLILLIKEITASTVFRRLIVGVSLLLILLIGFSRVYLRVHYPTDVLAGYLLGLLWVSGFALLFPKKPYLGL